MRTKSRITAQVTTVIALPFAASMLAACSSSSTTAVMVPPSTLPPSSAAPDQPVTWSGWELDPDVITPDDPSGSAVNQVFFLEPVVNFGNGNADFKADAVHSYNLLNCSAGVQGGPVIAVDPSVARANGCTAYTDS